MLTIIIVFIIFYLILFGGYLGFISLKMENTQSSKVSVIISAKNEAPVIKACLNSLKEVDYPSQNFEVILVDDHSSDDTYAIISDLISQVNNFRIIRADNKILMGKRGAILKGIKEARFPYIMITDADCFPLPGWLKTASGLFEQGYEFIFGPAPLIRKKNNFIGSLSCLENLKNNFLSFSLASLGLPYTAAARNMGFSKEAFFKIGGYDNTLGTLSGDDDLLLREAVRNKLKIKAFYDKNAMVYSYTVDKPPDYLKQRARHTQTSLHYSLKNKLILSGWHLLNLIMLFSPVLMFLDFNFFWLFIVKLLTDILVLYFVGKRFNHNFNPFRLLYLDIAYEIFLVINFFNSLFGKVEWKQS